MEKIKILVVDDESRMRKLVRDFLVREDYEVLEAGDGEAALDIFYQEKNIALIILDVMMPKMNGWEVCREIRETSKVPIIMLTAKGDEEDELRYLRNSSGTYGSFDRTFYRNLCGWLLWCISWCIYHVCGHRSCERYLKSAFRAAAGGGICAEDRSDRNGT